MDRSAEVPENDGDGRNVAGAIYGTLWKSKDLFIFFGTNGFICDAETNVVYFSCLLVGVI